MTRQDWITWALWWIKRGVRFLLENWLQITLGIAFSWLIVPLVIIITGSRTIHGALLHWAYDGICPKCQEPRSRWFWHDEGDQPETRCSKGFNCHNSMCWCSVPTDGEKHPHRFC